MTRITIFREYSPLIFKLPCRSATAMTIEDMPAIVAIERERKQDSPSGFWFGRVHPVNFTCSMPSGVHVCSFPGFVFPNLPLSLPPVLSCPAVLAAVLLV